MCWGIKTSFLAMYENYADDVGILGAAQRLHESAVARLGKIKSKSLKVKHISSPRKAKVLGKQFAWRLVNFFFLFLSVQSVSST